MSEEKQRVAPPGVDWTKSAPIAGTPDVPDAPIAQHKRVVSKGIDWTKPSGAALKPRTIPEELLPGQGADISTIIKGSFSGSYPETINYYARDMYPDEPVEQAEKRFGVKGDIIYHIPDLSRPDKAYAVAPGMKAIAGGVGPSLPVMASTAATVAGGPLIKGALRLAGVMGAGATAGGLAEAARQKFGDYLMNSPERYRSIAKGPVVREVTYGGAGAVPGPATVKYAERAAARDIAKMESAETGRAYSDAAHDGIPITAPEATGLPSLMATQKRLSQRVSTMDKAAAFYENRQTAIADAWDRMLAKIHPSGDIDALGKKAKETAVKIIDGVMEKRTLAARESYGKVVRPGSTAPEMPMDQYVVDTIAELRKDPLKGRRLAGLPDNDIVVIDAVGKDLRRQAKAAAKEGDNELSGILTSIRDGLIGRGSAVDRAFPEYLPARQEFANLSKEVEDMAGSIITSLSKVKDTDLMKVGMEVLDPSRRTPELVSRARRQISAVSSEAWDGIVKILMHTQSRAASKERATGMSLGGKLYYKFMGDPFMRKTLNSAMDMSRWTHFKRFMDTLKRTSKVKPFGSDTSMNLAANKEAEGKAATFVGKTLGFVGSPHNWGRMADDWMTARRLVKEDEKMAELIFDGASDPTVLKAMKELRKVSPNSSRFRMLLGAALTRVVEQGEKQLTKEDIQPER
jgi:hypothetical protein